MIEALSHITFIVHDLDRTENLLKQVLGARKVYDSGDGTFSIARERFFIAGGLWLVIMEGEALSTRSYNHVAFKIAEDELEPSRSKILALGLDIRESRPRIEGEGHSIYFHDYDNHLFELHTGTLEQRLARYRQGR